MTKKEAAVQEGDEAPCLRCGEAGKVNRIGKWLLAYCDSCRDWFLKTTAGKIMLYFEEKRQGEE
jgi:hypothetical protein